MKKITVIYATKSSFKRQEIEAVERHCFFRDENGDEVKIGNRFRFVFSDVSTDEPLEVDLGAMVRHKAISAYRQVLMPCIVEHAGLVLLEHENSGYPGGLTQPMMDALEATEFVRRMSAGGEVAIARAVIGYCDGMAVHVFTGETRGKIAQTPRGGREFYWDTVFCPDEFGGKTYAEITSDEAQGIPAKMKVSQSYRALRQFLEFRAKHGSNALFVDSDW